jgi:heat shock protein HtpX
MIHQITRNRRKSVLVMVLFLLFWLAAGYLLGLLFAHDAGVALLGMTLFGLLAVAGIFYSYFFGDRAVLAVSGARPADPQQYPQLHNIVEALAIGAGLPKPAIYVIDDPSPNAFATGRDPQHAAVTATSGLLQMLNREELEGVLSHELSHIRNYDVRFLLVVSTLVAMAGFLASWFWRLAFWRDRDARATLFLLATGAVLMLMAVVVGPLIQLAISRSRESLADASGVELTRNPAGLLSALRRIAHNDKPLKTFNHATAAMFIDNPLEHHRHWFHELFDTHPPIEERIAALERILQAQET